MLLAAPEYSEARKNTLQFIRRAVSEDSGGDYCASCEVLFADRARGLDRADTWRLLPAMRAVASDPLHRVIELESCFGSKRNRLSMALRRCHLKFSPSLSGAQRMPTGAYGGPGATFYTRRNPDHKERISPSLGGISAQDGKYWSQKKAKKVLKKLESGEYIGEPFASRGEYVELAMAMLTLSDFDGQMGRRGKKSSAGQILRRALDPGNIEYLLNGSRFLCNQPGMAGVDYPIGTCGNEAIARELKSWGENVIHQTRERMCTILKIFPIAKILSWVCRNEHPASRRMAQIEVLACASGVLRNYDGMAAFCTPGAGSPIRRGMRVAPARRRAMRAVSMKRSTVFTTSRKVAKPPNKRNVGSA